jgi:two-component system sensor histidine kinase MprB
MSLRTRIAAVAGVAVAITVIAVAAIVYVAVRSSLRGEVEDALVARAELPRPPLDLPFDARPVPPPDIQRARRFAPPPPEEAFGGAGGLVQRITPDGNVRRPSHSDVELPVEPFAREIAASGTGRDIRDTTVDGIHLMVLTEGAGDLGAVQAARPLTEVDDVLDEVLIVLIVVGLGGIALAALLGALVARTALEPIARFTRRTEAIAAEPDVSERMEVVGRDELGRLAQSFNTTLDALEQAVESQRQLVADASHELRTPIASLRANIQTLEQAERLPADELAALRSDILAELDELTALVSDVVELARGKERSGAFDDVQLDELVTSVIERARRRGNADVAYEAELEPTLVRGEPERIGRAVSNLLDNARKWSPNGRPVEVALRAGVLTVRDHGPGFDEADLPHVFDRFYRAKAARGMPGSGLGLAIVRQVAEVHGGRAEAENAPGGGALIRVTFAS